MGTTYTGLTGKSKEDFGIGNSRYITFLNVLTNAHIDTSILEYVNVEVSERQNQVKKGDLLFNTSSEVPEEVGMCSVLDENVNNVYLNSFCFGFRIANNNVCPAFLSYLMRGGIGRHMMSILAQGSTRFNLSKRSFCNSKISLPTLPEQTAIANYFTHLDTLISSTSRRLEKLRAVKAAALQTLFPQEGEKEPRVRFKGFCGEWKEVLIGDLGTTYTGLTGKSKEDFGIGNSRYITFLNVLTNAHIDTSILEYVNVEVSERQNQVKKGDLLFNTSSEVPEEVGMCSVLDENVNNVYLNSFCFGFRIANNNVCPAFLSYLMRGGIGRHMMSILAQGSTRFNLSKRSFCNSKISLPTLPEQTAIANYFTHLDDLIASTSRRLDKLRAVKSACLEGMFV